MDILLLVIFLCTMLLSIFMLMKKRKKENITGIKTLLTSLCFYGIATLNMAAYLFNFLGLLTFLVTIILLFLAAYFKRYLPRKGDQYEV